VLWHVAEIFSFPFTKSTRYEIFSTLPCPYCFGQRLAQRKKETQQTPEPVVKPAASPIEAKIAGLKKHPGFVEFYYDEKQDKVLILIDKLNTELLYVESLTAGVGSNDIGLDRNKLGRERIVKFEKRGPKNLDD
jgi:hypothetical protein